MTLPISHKKKPMNPEVPAKCKLCWRWFFYMKYEFYLLLLLLIQRDIQIMHQMQSTAKQIERRIMMEGKTNCPYALNWSLQHPWKLKTILLSFYGKVYTCPLAASHLLKPAFRRIAKSPISCGISCNSIANVVHVPTYEIKTLLKMKTQLLCVSFHLLATNSSSFRKPCNGFLTIPNLADHNCSHFLHWIIW